MGGAYMLSTCHFAETMPEEYKGTYIGDRCSFCGEPCHLLPQPRTLDHDIELTLRRWKDGDCSLDDMFERVNKEFRRAFHDLLTPAQRVAQGKKKPKFTYSIETLSWNKSNSSQLGGTK